MASSNWFDQFSLAGRVAIVTGGAGILGEVFCRGLSAAGARVVVADLDRVRAATLADDITATAAGDRRAIGAEVDVGDPRSVAQLVEQTEKLFGGIDILVNNAATKGSDLSAFFTETEEFTLETWREVMRVNLDGLFLMAQACGQQMLKKGRGSIINIASIYGLVGADCRIYEGAEYLGRAINTPPVYAASKAGVIGLTRHLATHWSGRGVRVNALTPGGVESGQSDRFRQAYAARVPMGRMARRNEMLGGLLYLASDASSYVTGHNLVIDGGWTAW
ncbi:SDR family oxidoreductase [Thermaurantiacus sp.]